MSPIQNPADESYSEQYPYQQQTLEILERVNAFQTGHFVYTSGLHGEEYIVKDNLYAYTAETSQICYNIANEFADDEIETVIGPAMGGIILAQWTAYHLSQISSRLVYSVFSEKVAATLELTRGYDKYIKGRKVLVVEDNLTTGGSVSTVTDLVRYAGGTVAGVGAICNRGNVQIHHVGNPEKFISLANIQMQSWEAHECPLCKSGVPINTVVEKGKSLLAQRS